MVNVRVSLSSRALGLPAAYYTLRPCRMMINHSTLDYHVTNFNTLSRWLLRTNQNSNLLL